MKLILIFLLTFSFSIAQNNQNENWTIIVHKTNSVNKAKLFIKKYIKKTNQKLYIKKSKNQYIVSYGSFIDNTEAKKYLNNKVPYLKKYNAYIINTKPKVQKVIKQVKPKIILTKKINKKSKSKLNNEEQSYLKNRYLNKNITSKIYGSNKINNSKEYSIFDNSPSTNKEFIGLSFDTINSNSSQIKSSYQSFQYGIIYSDYRVYANIIMEDDLKVFTAHYNKYIPSKYISIDNIQPYIGASFGIFEFFSESYSDISYESQELSGPIYSFEFGALYDINHNFELEIGYSLMLSSITGESISEGVYNSSYEDITLNNYNIIKFAINYKF